MNELKPCPFCGGVPKPKPNKEECWWYECDCCKTVIINYEEWNTRPIEDELRAEIARLKEENHALDQINRDIQTASAHLDEVLADLARRDEIITDLKLKLDVEQGQVKYLDEIIARLKEDGERLAATYVIEAFPHEWVCRGGCHHWARFGEKIEHSPDCPVTLHRALMKELEG